LIAGDTTGQTKQEELLMRKALNTLLFVCAGNTCRSPAAVQILEACLERHSINPQTWQVDSAGLRAVRGQPASAKMAAALGDRGMDLSEHLSRPVEDAFLRQYPLVLVMEREHRQDLLARFPFLEGKVFLLSEMSGGDGEVTDPFGGDDLAYDQTASQIENMIAQGFARIVELSAKKNKTDS
jgi:protein-tyrosine-phosphatase